MVTSKFTIKYWKSMRKSMILISYRRKRIRGNNKTLKSVLEMSRKQFFLQKPISWHKSPKTCFTFAIPLLQNCNIAYLDIPLLY